jgi:hypothetical protein
MNIQSYRILLGAAFVVLAGTVGAQTGSDTTYPSADKATQGTQAQQPVQMNTDSPSPAAQLPAPKDMAAADKSSSPHTSAKMSGHSGDQAQASDEAAASMQKPAKHAHHAARRASRPNQVAARGETTYRQALRQCAKEQDQGQRDSCLDNAIEQFQHNG